MVGSDSFGPKCDSLRNLFFNWVRNQVRNDIIVPLGPCGFCKPGPKVTQPYINLTATRLFLSEAVDERFPRDDSNDAKSVGCTYLSVQYLPDDYAALAVSCWSNEAPVALPDGLSLGCYKPFHRIC